MQRQPTALKNLSQQINLNNPKRLTYGQRAQLCSNPTAKKLFTIMEEKKTNLAAAADVTSKAGLLALVDAIGPEVCILKTHIDIIVDFDWDLIEQLQALARKHNFLIFEDRKFADIGNTVKLQYQYGIYRIAEWADIVNAHTVPGPGIIQGLKEVGLSRGRGLVLLPQMSSKGTLARGLYTEETLTMAYEYADFVIGFIAREKLVDDPRFIHMTPGVQLQEGSDKLGQQYLTPEYVITHKESDLIIVGRGIYQATDPQTVARTYRQAGWDAYEQRLG